MNPFVEIPVIIKTGILSKPKIVTGRILPGEISFHNPIKNGSLIVLRSGAMLKTSLNSSAIDTMRQVYDTMMKSNPGRVENMQMVVNKPDNNLTKAN